MTTTKQTKKQKLINASIRRLNTAYKKASPAGRRVLIARDALKQIRAEKYEVRYGAFVEYNELIDRLPESGENVQLQPYLHDPEAPSCRVCGIGSLFLSAVRCRNEFQANKDSRNPQEPVLNWLKEFSAEQRQFIEIAFEMGRGFYNYSYAYDTVRPGGAQENQFNATKRHYAAAKWASKFHIRNNERGCKEDKARLVAILKNIVRNRGQFNPYQR